MKKYLFYIGSIAFTGFALTSVVSCGSSTKKIKSKKNNQKSETRTSNEETETKKNKFDLDNLLKKSTDEQFKGAKDFLKDIKKGNINSFIYKGNEHTLDYSSQENLSKSLLEIEPLIKSSFPSLTTNDKNSNIVDTGIIKIDKQGIIPPPGFSFKYDFIPKAPEHTHWIFNSNDLYFEKDSEGKKLEHWTNLITSFKTPLEIKDVKDKYRIKAKLEANFGYLINNKNENEIVFKKAEIKDAIKFLNENTDFGLMKNKASIETKNDILERLKSILPNDITDQIKEENIILSPDDNLGKLKVQLVSSNAQENKYDWTFTIQGFVKEKIKGSGK